MEINLHGHDGAACLRIRTRLEGFIAALTFCIIFMHSASGQSCLVVRVPIFSSAWL